MNKSTSGHLEALVDFDNAYFKLNAAFAGKSIPFNLKGQRLSIIFPRFVNVDGKNKPSFKGTRIALNWAKTRNSKDQLIGAPSSWTGQGESQQINTFSFNTIIVRSVGAITAADARNIRKYLSEWSHVFVLWLEALEYLDLENPSTRVQQNNTVEAYYVYKAKRKPRVVKGRHEIGANITLSVRSTHNMNIFKKALRLSSAIQSPPSYYLYLISGLKHFNNQRYRHALLDAATAFEMAETELLSRKLKHLSKEQRKLIEDKYIQIDGLWHALNGLKVGIPTRNNTHINVATPRNKAMHYGSTIGRDVARNALEFTKEFIYTKLPM